MIKGCLIVLVLAGAFYWAYDLFSSNRIDDPAVQSQLAAPATPAVPAEKAPTKKAAKKPVATIKPAKRPAGPYDPKTPRYVPVKWAGKTIRVLQPGLGVEGHRAIQQSLTNSGVVSRGFIEARDSLLHKEIMAVKWVAWAAFLLAFAAIGWNYISTVRISRIAAKS